MIEAAYMFLFEKLDISTEEQDLITVKSVKRLGDSDGSCKGFYTLGKLDKIEIKIKQNSSVFGTIETIAHELVHAKQHLRGDFTWEPEEVPLFFGLLKTNVIVSKFRGKPLKGIPYFDQECEQEAFELSHQLSLEFFNNVRIATNTETESKS